MGTTRRHKIRHMRLEMEDTDTTRRHKIRHRRLETQRIEHFRQQTGTGDDN